MVFLRKTTSYDDVVTCHWIDKIPFVRGFGGRGICGFSNRKPADLGVFGLFDVADAAEAAEDLNTVER